MFFLFTGTPLRCILLRKESGGASAEFKWTFYFIKNFFLPWQSLSKLDSAHLAYKKLTLRSARSDIPACILSSRWDYVRTAVLCRGWNPCLYYNVPTGLAFVLFHKTFWASPRQSSSKLDSALGSLQNWTGWKGDAPTEFWAEWAFIQGLRPLGSIPACIITSLRDYSLSSHLLLSPSTLLSFCFNKKETLKRREGIGPLPSF